MQWQLIVLTSLDFPLKNKAKKAFSPRPRANARLGKTISNAPETMNTSCGRVVRDFESEAKNKCNFQFR